MGSNGAWGKFGTQRLMISHFKEVLILNSRYKKIFPVTWDQLHRDSKALAWKLMDFKEVKGIIAVTRGGLVPAAIIARELEIRLVDTICISSYDYQKQGQLKILKSLHIEDSQHWLIIDDLVDTGETAKVIRSILPESLFATVYAKPKGRPLVDIYVTEVSQDTWILFPWDSEPTFSEPLIKKRGLNEER